MDLTCYNSYYEVNLSVLEENFKKISRFIAPAQVIPVLKADAYGMGALEIARVLTERCGCRTLACSQTYEGLVLRKGGITDAEILIMGPVLHDTLPHAVRWDMQIPLFTPERVRSLSREAARQGKTVKAQIKIETGLNPDRSLAWKAASGGHRRPSPVPQHSGSRRVHPFRPGGDAGRRLHKRTVRRVQRGRRPA